MAAGDSLPSEKKPLPMAPGCTPWLDRMDELTNEIQNARAQGNWYVVEIRARELAIMCEMRRTR